RLGACSTLPSMGKAPRSRDERPQEAQGAAKHRCAQVAIPEDTRAKTANISSITTLTRYCMSESYDPHPAAMRLAAAWKSGTRFPELPVDGRPADSEQAYAIQAALRDEIGEGIAGWKIGGASV